MSTNKSIARSAGIISIATLCSRVLGFIRDMIIARLFGIAQYSQAFVVAFKIPNLLRDSIGEGAANAAFVPVFSKYALQQSKEEFWHLANIVLNVLFVVLSGITLLGIAFSPVLVRMMAPGFIADPEKLAVTITLNRIIFPYILLVSLAAYAMALLNSLKYFVVSAFAPCLLNVSIIICALLWGEGTRGLASGVLIGGMLQLLVQIPFLYRRGFAYRPLFQWQHPIVKNIGLLMLPRVFSSCIYQLNNFVDSIYGSLAWIVGEGGVAVLYFSYRLIQFPIGIFSNSLSQAILPAMSSQALEENGEKIKNTLSFGLRANFFVMLPASALAIALAYPIVSTLFGGGRFDEHSALLTSQCLVFYSIGLCAYGATKILQSCFFALHDTRTPAKIAFLALIMTIVFNTILIFPLKIAGIALASSLSGISSCIILFLILRKKLSLLPVKLILGAFIRILFASAGAGVVAGAAVYLTRAWPQVHVNQVIRLFMLFGVSIASYVIFCFLFKVSEMSELWRLITKTQKTA